MSSILTVILNWRTPDMTLQSLAAARSAMQGLDGEIVVVDNDSQDGSFETISAATEHMANVRVLQSGRNGGFGAGNNVGIRAGLSDGSRPDYFYILNSDAFPAPDSIALLTDHLDRTPAAGFAGSYIYGSDGFGHLTTFRFPSALGELEGAARFGPISRLLRRWAVPVPTPQTSCRVDWLAGASMMMRSDVLDQTGLFDETFFLYFEETDLCLRARNAGYEVHFVRESAVEHIGSVSTGMKEWAETPDYWFASRAHYFAKNHGRGGLALATLAHAVGGALHRLRCAIGRKSPSDPPKFLRRLIANDLAVLFRSKRRPAQVERRTT